jgi:hypothetical protein
MFMNFRGLRKKQREREGNVRLSVVMHTCNSSSQEAEDPKFETSLGYVLSSRPIWATKGGSP